MITCKDPTFTLKVPKPSGVVGSSRVGYETWSFAEVEPGSRIALCGFIVPELDNGTYPPGGFLWGFYLGTEYLPFYLTTHVTFRIWCHVNGRGAFSVTLNSNPGGRAYNASGLDCKEQDPNPREQPELPFAKLQEDWSNRMARRTLEDMWPRSGVVLKRASTPVCLKLSQIK